MDQAAQGHPVLWRALPVDVSLEALEGRSSIYQFSDSVKKLSGGFAKASSAGLKVAPFHKTTGRSSYNDELRRLLGLPTSGGGEVTQTTKEAKRQLLDLTTLFGALVRTLTQNDPGPLSSKELNLLYGYHGGYAGVLLVSKISHGWYIDCVQLRFRTRRRHTYYHPFIDHDVRVSTPSGILNTFVNTFLITKE